MLSLKMGANALWIWSMYGIVKYWRIVFDGPGGVEALRLSKEYANATCGSVWRGKPSVCSVLNSRAIVPNSHSFHDGLLSWSRRPINACSSPPRWELYVHAITDWAPSSRPK